MLQLFPNHLFFCPLFPADAQQLLVDNSSVIWAEPLNQKGNNLLWINPDGNNFQRVQQASSFPLTRVDQTNFIPGSNLSSVQCRHKPIVNILSNFATMRHPTYDNEKIGMCCVLTDAGNLVPMQAPHTQTQPQSPLPRPTLCWPHARICHCKYYRFNICDGRKTGKCLS